MKGLEPSTFCMATRVSRSDWIGVAQAIVLAFAASLA